MLKRGIINERINELIQESIVSDTQKRRHHTQAHQIWEDWYGHLMQVMMALVPSSPPAAVMFQSSVRPQSDESKVTSDLIGSGSRITIDPTTVTLVDVNTLQGADRFITGIGVQCTDSCPVSIAERALQTIGIADIVVHEGPSVWGHL